MQPLQEVFDQAFEERQESTAVEDVDIATNSLFAWELEGGGWARNFESTTFSTCHVSELLSMPQCAHPGPPVALHLSVNEENDGMTGWLQCRTDGEQLGSYSSLKELAQEFLRLLQARSKLD